jgi:N-acetylglutamate synthase-like GNAT family acetyltransferase
MVAELLQVTLGIPMTSGNEITFRKAILTDLDAIKRLADMHRTELGFVLRPSLEKSIHDREIIVAFHEDYLVGFVHYHHRKDQQTTLYHIAVHPSHRSCGIGQELVSRLRADSRESGKILIRLKCPVTLPSNQFYQQVGFQLAGTEDGKERKLNVWQAELV